VATSTKTQLVFDLLPNETPFFRSRRGNFTLYCGDSLKLLAAMPDECVDLIFADPPYFLSNGGITCHAGKMVSVNKGDWDKSEGVDENHAFNSNWLGQCQRILRRDGTIWVSGTSHVIHSVGFALQQLGFKLLNDITWYKRNAPPNLSCRYFTHSTETVIWAAKSTKSKHVFNYAEMRSQANGKQMRNLWLFDDAPEEDGSKFPEDVWQIGAPNAREKVLGKHPTQKPLALLRRIIEASSLTDQVVLDPFNGSGTTGIAAVDLGRRYIGIDADRDFLNLSRMRFEQVER